ncbi:MAG: hypothetical protein ACFCGT_11645 [Sandaracinaceae bacterium]
MRLDRIIYLATAASLTVYAVVAQDWVTLAATVGWLALMRFFRWSPSREATSPDRRTSLRRWRSVLALFGLAAVGLNAFSVDQLASEGTGTFPVLVSTALIAASAAWLAWTQQELRQLD